ncbi:MAG: DUF4982 domain-containing protein, partial [Lachnospiraceae bacterium]|nr:DUF4982 domain-containing protein [Lachnospiraceae bacterium]
LFHPYGYTKFAVNLDPYLYYGAENTIRVIARNSDQPNSRWYSGTGIYRPVWVYKGPKEHLLPYGIKIRTLSVNEPAKIEISIDATSAGTAEITVFEEDAEQKPAVSNGQVEIMKNDAGYHATMQMSISNAKLWDTDHPQLYRAKVRFGEDTQEAVFGIRLIEYGPAHGLTINGRHVILKGACIHHDNGILGACAFPEAEERKVRLHKEQGYNALRSAHNPCSEALLQAADRLGMLVMDEYVDCWYIHKTKYDYVNYLEEWWPKDLKDMVEKDYNHPSVIMYSTGNEVAETGEKKGIELTGSFTEYLHQLDGSRPVSCGINIFFNFLYSAGFGVYSDEKAEQEAKKPVGSEFYNTLAGIFGDTTMKMGAALPMCDVKTRDAYANMDIAGYNYGILRYRKDLKKYPNRLILGSETFCKDTWKWLEMAKENERIIGDFVWAGMDYLGEAGIGSWEYEQYAPKNAPKEGWLTAGSGRLDILGMPNGEAAYTRVVYGKQAAAITVKPLCDQGSHSPSAWKLTQAQESWSYDGHEGEKAEVEVYARGDFAELWLNGRRIGKKKIPATLRTYFTVPYEHGVLKAVIYDRLGNRLSSTALTSAAEQTRISIVPESASAQAGEIVFVPITYTDPAGIRKPGEMHRIRIDVKGATLLGFGNACAYNPDGYCQTETFTYYGQAMAAIRMERGEGATITVSDEER